MMMLKKHLLEVEKEESEERAIEEYLTDFERLPLYEKYAEYVHEHIDWELDEENRPYLSVLSYDNWFSEYANEFIPHTKEESPELPAWYFTFGSAHLDHKGKPLTNKYYIVHADAYITARKLMFKVFGSFWAFQYSEEEFKGQVEAYNLVEYDPTKEI